MPSKAVLSRVPITVTAAMQTTAINATINPYSTIVAPSSSCAKRVIPCSNPFMMFSPKKVRKVSHIGLLAQATQTLPRGIAWPWCCGHVDGYSMESML
jgi:hypothetical protein